LDPENFSDFRTQVQQDIEREKELAKPKTRFEFFERFFEPKTEPGFTDVFVRSHDKNPLERNSRNAIIQPGTTSASPVAPQSAPSYSLLQRAVKQNDVDAVTWLINVGRVDPNEFGEDGQPVLYSAVKKGHLAMCYGLIQGGAATNIKTKQGKTLLEYAIECRKNKSMEDLPYDEIIEVLNGKGPCYNPNTRLTHVQLDQPKSDPKHGENYTLEVDIVSNKFTFSDKNEKKDYIGEFDLFEVTNEVVLHPKQIRDLDPEHAETLKTTESKKQSKKAVVPAALLNEIDRKEPLRMFVEKRGELLYNRRVDTITLTEIPSKRKGNKIYFHEKLIG